MEETLPNIYISSTDFEKLSRLANNVKNSAAEELEEELGRAVVVPDSELSPTIVAMNSTLKFRDLESKSESTITLVYPEKADAGEGRISILAPIGIALIGLKLDEIIEWPVPGGQTRRLQVVSITRA